MTLRGVTQGEEGLAKLEPAFVSEAQGQVGERLQYRVRAQSPPMTHVHLMVHA